jgi:inosine-uridine nucleoside N-ribohydrolase
MLFAAAAIRGQLPSANYGVVSATLKPQLKLVAVTTVWGNRPLSYVNNVSAASMRILGLSDVPMYIGAEVALMPQPIPTPWPGHGEFDQVCPPDWPPLRDTKPVVPSSEHAVMALIRLVTFTHFYLTHSFKEPTP